MSRVLRKFCLFSVPVWAMACTGEIDGGAGGTGPAARDPGMASRPPGPSGRDPGPAEPPSSVEPPSTISGARMCVAGKPGPRLLRRLSAEQLDNSVRDLFRNQSAPRSDVFNDPQVLGFTADAGALLVRDLGSQQLMTYAEQVARWAVSTVAADLAPCDQMTPECRTPVRRAVRPAGVSPAPRRGQGRPLREAVRQRPHLRAGPGADDHGHAPVALLSVPARAGRAGSRQARAGPPHVLRGGEQHLLPHHALDARRSAAAGGGRQPAPHPRADRRPGRAPARGSQESPDHEHLHGRMAGVQTRGHGAQGSGRVRLPRRPPGGHGAGDGGPRRGHRVHQEGLADRPPVGRLHLRQRQPGQALRHHRGHRRRADPGHLAGSRHPGAGERPGRPRRHPLQLAHPAGQARAHPAAVREPAAAAGRRGHDDQGPRKRQDLPPRSSRPTRRTPPAPAAT